MNKNKLLAVIIGYIVYVINLFVLGTYVIQDWMGEEVDIKIIKCVVMTILTFIWLEKEKRLYYEVRSA